MPPLPPAQVPWEGLEGYGIKGRPPPGELVGGALPAQPGKENTLPPAPASPTKTAQPIQPDLSPVSEPLTVYVVDDDPGVLQAVLAILARPVNGFELLGASPGGDIAPELVADADVDLFVCDWRLPNADGLDLIARAKELHPPVRTILMTGFPSPELSIRAFAVGVDAMLFKPFNGPQLLATLGAAWAGHRVFCDEAARHVADFLRQQEFLTATGAEALLNAREIEVLRLLGTGKTAKEAADLTGLTEATVATYRKHAFKKLGVHKLPEALNKLRGGGQKVVK